jgi:hypothetical protein
MSDHDTSNSMKIRSNDGKIFEIDEGIIEQSSLIKEYYDLFKLSDSMFTYSCISYEYYYFI